MAKLFTSYPLCPVDIKTFLGIADDYEDGNVILTQGNKIVLRYKLEDQKQLNSWSNLDKLTSVVIYAVDLGKYVGVFDYNQIKIWAEDEQLDKVKKYKFEDSIFNILTSKILKKTFVIFQNGKISHLSEAIKKRKESQSKNIFKKNEVIESSTLCSHNEIDYVAFFTLNGQDKSIYLVSIEDNTIKKRITSKDKSNPLNSWCIMQTENQVNLLTLWTDGTMYSLNLFNRLYHSEFPGTFVHKFSSIDCYKPTRVLPLGERHIVIYGSDNCDEGASMIVYSFKFNVIQARHHYKFFSNPPFLAKVDNNILVMVGNNLGVLPYELNQTFLHSAIDIESSSTNKQPNLQDWLVSSTPNKQASLQDWLDRDEQEIGIENDETDSNSPPLECIKELMDKKGFPHSRLEDDESVLKFIEEKDIPNIISYLENCDQKSENQIGDVLQFALNSDDSLFTNIVNGTAEPMDVDEEEEEEEAGPLTPEGRRHLIDLVLQQNVKDLEMIPNLRNISLDHCILLLKHVAWLLKKDQENETLILWASLLLNSHYQAYILSSDPEIKTIFLNMREIVDEKILCIEELNSISLYIERLKQSKSFIQKDKLANRFYSIKRNKLY